MSGFGARWLDAWQNGLFGIIRGAKSSVVDCCHVISYNSYNVCIEACGIRVIELYCVEKQVERFRDPLFACERAPPFIDSGFLLMAEYSSNGSPSARTADRASNRQKLWHMLRAGKPLTLSDIERELGVSKRHARRLVKQVEDNGLTLDVRKRGREKEYCVPPEEQAATIELDLSEREALALVLASAVATSGPGPVPLGDALQRAFSHVTSALSNRVVTFEPDLLQQHVYVREAGSVEIDGEVFITLLDAISNRRRLVIDYHTASTNTYRKGRRIEPWALTRLGDAWMCVAKDPDKDPDDNIRDFNLARMSNVGPADPKSRGGDYRIPDDFDLEIYLSGRFESLSGEKAYTVRLRVGPEQAPYFRSKTYHRTQQIEGEEASGHLIVSYDVVGLEEITTFIRSWGAGVEVTDPPELRNRLLEDATAMQAMYGSAENGEEA